MASYDLMTYLILKVLIGLRRSLSKPSVQQELCPWTPPRLTSPLFPVLHHSLRVQLRNCCLPEDIIWVWKEWHRRKWKSQESFHTDAKDLGKPQGCWEWPRRSSDAQFDPSYKGAKRWHWLDTFIMRISLLPQYPTVPHSSTSAAGSDSSSLGESSCLAPRFTQLWGAHLSAHHRQL